MVNLGGGLQRLRDELVIRSMAFLLTRGMMWSARNLMSAGYGLRATRQAR